MFLLKIKDTEILMNFLQNNGNSPSKEEKEMLVKQTSMTKRQISNWFKNKRQRTKENNDKSIR